jgi:MFS family permease
MSTVAEEGFSLGRVISLSFQVFVRNIVPFGILTVLMLGVPQLAFLAMGISSSNPALAVMAGDWSGLAMAGIVFVVMFLAIFVLYGALVFGTFRDLSGNRASIGELISRGLARTLPLLAVSILAFLGLMLGAMLLIVPFFILACMWAVVVPANVVEGAGVIDSFKRSATLTSGYRWHIFGLGILYYVFAIVLGLVLVAVILLTSKIVPHLGDVVSFLINAATTAFFSVSLTVIYAELRRVKEGASVTEIARVFD